MPVFEIRIFRRRRVTKTTLKSGSLASGFFEAVRYWFPVFGYEFSQTIGQIRLFEVSGVLGMSRLLLKLSVVSRVKVAV